MASLLYPFDHLAREMTLEIRTDGRSVSAEAVGAVDRRLPGEYDRHSRANPYSFDSILPAHYPDRVAQHVHFKVSAPGHKPLVTQLYFATDPAFEGNPDKNFSRDPLVESRELVRPVTIGGDPASPRAFVTFELVLETA